MAKAGVGHLVGIGDAHHALAVLKQLRHFRDFRPRDWNNFVEDVRVYLRDGLERTGSDIVQSRYDLGDLSCWWFGPTRINPLRVTLAGDNQEQAMIVQRMRILFRVDLGRE